MAKQLAHQDLLDAVDRAIDESYLGPMKAGGDGYELIHAHAAIGERASLAVARFERDGFIMSSEGARLATVQAIFYRQQAAAGAGTVLAGTLVRASRCGQVFRTTENAVFSGGALEVTVPAVSIGYGYEWNIKGKFVDPQGVTWPGELDTIDLPLQDPPFWDPTIRVRNDTAADGLGRPATLDALGEERDLRRQPNESDQNYRVRIRTMPDTVTPNAIARQVKNFLRPYGMWWRLVETCAHEYQECFDAPDIPPTPYEPYDANLFCFDDPRAASPMRNRLLGEQDHLGAFILEIEEPPVISDFGFVFDDPAVTLADLQSPVGIRAFSAFDAPDTLSSPALTPVLDGIDLGANSMIARLAEMLDEIKGAGVYAVICIRDPVAAPLVAATLDTIILAGDVAGLLTDGAPWTATLQWREPGSIGNGKVLDIRVNASGGGSVPSAEVRDNQRYDAISGWVAASGTVGVLVGSDVGAEATVGVIEAAINAGSSLAFVTSPDLSPSKKVNAAMDETTISATFDGGI